MWPNQLLCLPGRSGDRSLKIKQKRRCLLCRAPSVSSVPRASSNFVEMEFHQGLDALFPRPLASLIVFRRGTRSYPLARGKNVRTFVEPNTSSTVVFCWSNPESANHSLRGVRNFNKLRRKGPQWFTLARNLHNVASSFDPGAEIGCFS